MAWEKFNPNLAAHDLVQDMKWDPKLREERKAIEERDFRTLYDLGMHPYLGGQLSRFIWGNDAGKGAVEASNKLVASLQGHSRDIPNT
jgi:protocatechuate 4,5-dioxygenase alpha chain